MKNAVKSREIEVVWHFTRLSNLDSILTHGLKSINELEQLELPTEVNDQYRFDGQTKAICCSIEHPNYKMFYRLRQENPEIDWVTIAIKPSILWKKDCAFCIENAASSNVASIPIELRKGVDAFNKLYEDIEDKPTRKEMRLHSSYPTNPQAELLVFDNIKPKHFMGVVTNQKAIANALQEKHEGLKVLLHNGPFSARADYEHWR